MKIITIVGARPQFVKAGVVSRAFSKMDSMHEFIVHTGQHYDDNMSDLFFREMNVPHPFVNLQVNQMEPEQMISKMVDGIEAQIVEIQPDFVLVYGDTYSTLAGAMAAANRKVKLVHVEAGLRSFNMQMPEERNRVLTDQYADLLFCPTAGAMSNLKNEGFDEQRKQYFFSGDVMLDAMLFYRKKALAEVSVYHPLLQQNFALCTFHRHENIENDDRLRSLVESLNKIHSMIPIVCPLHPHTAQRIRALGLKLNVQVIEPVGYFEMIRLLDKCSLVITDSGGLQKESFFSRKICICLRTETEWKELLEGGYVVLTGIDQQELETSVKAALGVNLTFLESYYGDGKAGEFISEHISKSI